MQVGAGNATPSIRVSVSSWALATLSWSSAKLCAWSEKFLVTSWYRLPNSARTQVMLSASGCASISTRVFHEMSTTPQNQLWLLMCIYLRYTVLGDEATSSGGEDDETEEGGAVAMDEGEDEVDMEREDSGGGGAGSK